MTGGRILEGRSTAHCERKKSEQPYAKGSCSDPELANVGGAPWLFWKLIQEARSSGLRELDLGRSDWENPGLITFEDRLGAKRIPVTYWRFPKPQEVADALADGR